MTTETALLQSWQHNAQAWIDAVRSGSIASRQQVTDQAVLLAILGLQPQRVLDVGCGEGWLLRALAEHGVAAVGVDGDAQLVAAAQAAGSPAVHLASYQQLAEGSVDIGRDYDLICANFALLQQDIVPLLSTLRELLTDNGALVIQTLHPWSVPASEHQDGWREESFAGFAGHWQPMPWYFRTLSSWVDALALSGFNVEEFREPQLPHSQERESLLLVARPCQAQGTGDRVDG